MAGDTVMAAGALAAVVGIAALRLAWSRAERSVILNTVGWASIGAGLVAGWAFAGAWGASVVSLWMMGAALVLLAIAAWRDPAQESKASNRRAAMLPEPGETRYLARRSITFAIVNAGGLAGAIAFGIFTRWAALLGSASEADANVLAFFAVPLAWSVFAFILLMTPDRTRQLTIIALPVVAALPAVAEGMMS